MKEIKRLNTYQRVCRQKLIDASIRFLPENRINKGLLDFVVCSLEDFNVILV